MLAAEQVAHQVALHDGKASAFVEVGDGDAGCRGIDEVVGDQRAFEAELGVDGDLAEARARVGDDLDVGRSVAAHGAKAQSVMRLPETSTLPARKTLTPLPFSPVPPPSARMRTMRLAATMLPSSPASERHTWMPLLPQSATSLWAISSPPRRRCGWRPG